MDMTAKDRIILRNNVTLMLQKYLGHLESSISGNVQLMSTKIKIPAILTVSFLVQKVKMGTDQRPRDSCLHTEFKNI